MNQDFVDLLQSFVGADVRFLIVGAYALALHGHPRATGDLDIWVEPTAENARRVMKALESYGAPTSQVSEADFSKPGVVLQLGISPRRVDILTELTELNFPEAWQSRVCQSLGTVEAGFLGWDCLIANKRATGRPQDLADLQALGE